MLLIAGLLTLIHITWSATRYSGCDERGPVCGNDGKTYLTLCHLTWAKLEDPDLQVLHGGNCNVHGIEPRYQEQFMKLESYRNHPVLYSSTKMIMPYGWPPMGPVVDSMPENNRKKIRRKEA